MPYPAGEDESESESDHDHDPPDEDLIPPVKVPVGNELKAVSNGGTVIPAAAGGSAWPSFPPTGFPTASYTGKFNFCGNISTCM
jgi:hypothetical protein